MRSLKKKVLSFILFLLLVFTIRTEIYAAITVNETDDPEYWSAQGYIDDAFYDSTSTLRKSNTTTPGRGDYILRKGIDVSKWQGDIDWKKAKDAGVEFAIIRVGYRSDSTGALNEDTRYIENIEGALENDIRVGVYIFSQAITEAEAVEEANYVLSRIYNYNISLPVVIDYEYRSTQNGVVGRLYDAQLSKEEATSICKAFCQTVETAGYTGMVYANKNMLMNHLNAEEIASNYRIWLAHYTEVTNYTGTYDFWQYTSQEDGATYGMESSYVDMNWWYDDGKISENSTSVEQNQIVGKFATYDGCNFYRDSAGNVTCKRQDGSLVINEFRCDGTYTYYFQLDGTAMKDRLSYHPDGIHVIYFDEYGHEVFSNFVNVKRTIAGDAVDDLCFFDVYGYLYVDVVTYDQTGTKLYYVNPYGVLERGKWFQFSNTVKCADGTPWNGAAGNYGYANADGTLMKDTHTYNWEDRLVYMQGNGVMTY